MKSITQVVENLIKPYIDRHNRAAQALTAPVETDATSASKNYTVGKQLILGDILYNVTAPITAGDALVVNTNIEVAPDITGQISSLNQTLTNNVSDITAEIADMNNVLGAKNILPNNVGVGTISGVTFTKNPDGSISISGTASAELYHTIADISLKAGKYILNGAPSGSSIDNATIYATVAPSYSDSYIDYGNGVEFTLSNDSVVRVNVTVANGQTVNKTFYPMLRPASIADDTYEPYSMTNQELTPIAQAVSNRNLIDNPWFTVNQREKTSWSDISEYEYCADRWIIPSSSTGSIQNGVISNSQAVYQKMEDSRIIPLLGKKVTLSWMLSDGTIESETATFPSSLTSSFVWVFTNNKVIVGLRDGNQSQCPRIQANISVKAVKLELGEVSTLAMDTAPNYAEELLKCQRYFVRIGKDNEFVSVGIGQARTESLCSILAPLPVQMRAKPSLSISGSVKLRNGSTPNTSTGGSVDSYPSTGLLLALISTGLTAGNAYDCFVGNGTDNYIDLSADL